MLSKTAIKYIQSLSFKKFRDENDIFIAEGPKVVEEIIKEGSCKCKAIYALESYINVNKDLFTRYSINYIQVSEIELKKISLMKTPNKVLALLFKKPTINFKDHQGNVSILLDNINDPGNMGTIIRIADWFGVQNIFCSEDCVDVYNPKVIQSSMASIARLNIIYTDLNNLLIENPSVFTFAATLDGKNIFGMEKKEGCFLIIGNESNGIHPLLLKKTHEKISIKKIGNAESLNAAVATGIIMACLKN